MKRYEERIAWKDKEPRSRLFSFLKKLGLWCRWSNQETKKNQRQMLTFRKGEPSKRSNNKEEGSSYFSSKSNNASEDLGLGWKVPNRRDFLTDEKMKMKRLASNKSSDKLTPSSCLLHFSTSVQVSHKSNFRHISARASHTEEINSKVSLPVRLWPATS